MKLNLYQVFFNKEQPLDPQCIPLDACGVNVVPLYENKHILDTYNKGLEGADYYGVTSWRMKEKTGLMIQQLRFEVQDE